MQRIDAGIDQCHRHVLAAGPTLRLAGADGPETRLQAKVGVVEVHIRGCRRCGCWSTCARLGGECLQRLCQMDPTILAQFGEHAGAIGSGRYLVKHAAHLKRFNGPCRNLCQCVISRQSRRYRPCPLAARITGQTDIAARTRSVGQHRIGFFFDGNHYASFVGAVLVALRDRCDRRAQKKRQSRQCREMGKQG